MWKNKSDRKKLKGVYTTFSIQGLNLDRFINYVKNKGIVLYNVKKFSNKQMIITVNFRESQKFFAIANKMCYNIKKVRDFGALYPVYYILSSLGILLGAIAFVIILCLSNDYIYSINFSGTGSIYKTEVKEYLEDIGVKEYSRFSEIDLQKLEDQILKDNEHLSFVSLKKEGNTLAVEMALSSGNVKRLDGNIFSLSSDVDGEIESIKVYRGKKLVNVGDKVKKGDLLASGEVEINQQILKINVLCSVTILVTEEYEYLSSSDNDEKKAELIALLGMEGIEVLNSEVTKSQVDDGYLYRVTMKYRRVLIAG